MRNEHIAVIGLTGRFPGGSDARGLWQKLRNGESCIKTISKETLRSTVHAPHVDDPYYVFRCAVLQSPDIFDAEAFRMNHADALITDPQQRVFLECCHEALGAAGLPDPESRNLRAGVFAGCSTSIYLLHNIMGSAEFSRRDLTQLLMGTEKDFIATRVAYRLNLRGASMTVQTGCSTSLVAVHQACRALINDEVDLALAGGATITGLGEIGYLYTPGGIRSSDGLCRPYDIHADGTIFGDGVGVVALCRLEDAIANGSFIHAVIRGSAINNNGSDCAGFAAPSVSGQAGAIKSALRNAGVRAEDISFVEGHGTATALGDPIEVRALSQAYETSSRQYCALCSVKSNVGHLDVASGVTGLIKTVMSLRERWLPGMLNFTEPNPALKLESTPFFIGSEGRALPRDTEIIAGVSSFGFGGTNAHVILSTPPENRRNKTEAGSPPVLYLWSARSEKTLDAYLNGTAEAVRDDPVCLPEEVAHTLARGRYRFAHRAILAKKGLPLRETMHSVVRGKTAETPVMMVMLFPGQGTAWSGVAGELYQNEAVFRREVDRLSAAFFPFLQADIRSWLFPGEEQIAEAKEKERQTRWSQPALFILCAAVFAVYRSLGVKPQIVAGHSLGELVAAYVAGAIPDREIAGLVDSRARLMAATKDGAMLAVSLPASRTRWLLGDMPLKADIAAINGLRQTIVSGAAEAIDLLAARCREDGVRCKKLPVQKAFHSHLMDDILPEWRKSLMYEAAPLQYGLASNVTGRIVEPGQTLDSDYWLNHLRGAVDFAGGIDSVMDSGRIHGREPVFMEVGPGTTMSTLVRMQFPDARVTASCDADGMITTASLLAALGSAWIAGADLDLDRLIPRSRIVDLPVAPLDGKRYWITPDAELGQESRSAAPTPHRIDTGIALAGQRVDPGEIMLSIWKKIILNDEITIDDNFFALGGDSMQALEISRELASSGIVLKPTDILKKPVIRELLKDISPAGDIPAQTVSAEIAPQRGESEMSEDEVDAMMKQLGIQV